MPATVRKRKAGEKGKLWKIVGPTGAVEGESDSKRDAEISANIRTRAHKEKLAKARGKKK